MRHGSRKVLFWTSSLLFLFTASCVTASCVTECDHNTSPRLLLVEKRARKVQGYRKWGWQPQPLLHPLLTLMGHYFYLLIFVQFSFNFFNFNIWIISVSIFQYLHFFHKFYFFLYEYGKKKLSWESAIYVRNVSQQPTASYFRRRL